MPRGIRAGSSRETETRERVVRRWQPPSNLDAPDPPNGYVHRWVRTGIKGEDDLVNFTKRTREGWEPVKGAEYTPEGGACAYPTDASGNIATGGLVLARIPKDIADDRNDYFREQTEAMLSAQDEHVMRETGGAVRVNRQSSSTRGPGADAVKFQTD